MKKSIITLMLSFSMVFAITLSDYVAKFDKELAIQLYESDLEIGHDVQASYSALARLYNETGKIGLAEDCYRHLIDIHNGSEESYHWYLDFLFENNSYKKLRHIIFENEFSQDWGQYLVARSYFKEAKFDSSLLFTENLPEDLAADCIVIHWRASALKNVLRLWVELCQRSYPVVERSMRVDCLTACRHFRWFLHRHTTHTTISGNQDPHRSGPGYGQPWLPGFI